MGIARIKSEIKPVVNIGRQGKLINFNIKIWKYFN